MKRSWTALAVALSSIFVIAGCNDYGNTFQNNTGASVTFLSPSNISAGSPDFTITVNGRASWPKLSSSGMEKNSPPRTIWTPPATSFPSAR